MINRCPIRELEEALQRAEAVAVDVRENAEYRSEHIDGTVHIPLSKIAAAAKNNLDRSKRIYLVCRSGGRAAKAAEQLESLGYKELRVVEGGIQAWIRDGKTVVRGATQIWSLDRQVRFAAGLLVLTGIILSLLVHPAFLTLSIFVTGGLIFSAVTDTCAMACLLSKMPWNQKSA
jgi:rhodanese-related sulfurtransferase